MTKYNVCEVRVETSTGKNAYQTFNEQTNQTPDTTVSFDTLEAAREYYATVNTGVKYCGNRLYEHYCKYLEVVEVDEVDEDGEFVSGGDWLEYDFPDSHGAADEDDEGDDDDENGDNLINSEAWHLLDNTQDKMLEAGDLLERVADKVRDDYYDARENDGEDSEKAEALGDILARLEELREAIDDAVSEAGKLLNNEED